MCGKRYSSSVKTKTDCEQVGMICVWLCPRKTFQHHTDAVQHRTDTARSGSATTRSISSTRNVNGPTFDRHRRTQQSQNIVYTGLVLDRTDSKWWFNNRQCTLYDILVKGTGSEQRGTAPASTQRFQHVMVPSRTDSSKATEEDG